MPRYRILIECDGASVNEILLSMSRVDMSFRGSFSQKNPRALEVNSKGQFVLTRWR